MIAGLIDLKRGAGPCPPAAPADGASFGCGERWSDAENGLSLSGSALSRESNSRYVVAFEGRLDSRDGLPAQGLEVEGCRAEKDRDAAFIGGLLDQYGVPDALPHVSGPFSLVIWDKVERELTLVLDRIGQEVLYCARFDECFLFSSDLAVLKQHAYFRGEMDFAALGLYYRHNYIPAPHTVYKNVKKLLPGTYLQIRPLESLNVVEKYYWNPVDRFEQAVSNRFKGSFADAVDELDTLLTDSIRRRVAGSASVGAFLSGGVDSSLISAIAQKVSGGKLQTFSVGFDEAAFNEAGHARRVAEHIGSEHRELRVTAGMAADLIERLPGVYAEPFADSSQIPTTLISRHAKEFTDVVLSGDGGDEVFGGYRTYPLTERLWKKFVCGRPLFVRQAMRVACELIARLPVVGRRNMLRGAKLAKVLAQEDPESIFKIITALAEPDPALLLEPEAPSILTDRARRARGGDLKERLMFLDFGMYMPDDCVVKVREAARYAGLQVLSPILDHRIVEFAWSLPVEYKIQGESGKAVLKELLYRYVPRDIVDRPKRGFAMPLPLWLDDQLAPWARGLWAESASRIDDLFGKGYLSSLKKHYGKVNAESRWGILRLLQWLNHA